MLRFRVVLLSVLALPLLGCPASESGPAAGVADVGADGAVAQDVLPAEDLPPAEDSSVSDGRTVSGKAWFFDLGDGLAITQVEDVTGAVVSVFELPERQVSLDESGEFSLDGLPQGVPLTFALKHPDFMPMLTRTFVLGAGEDIAGLTFQAVSNTIAAAAGGIVGVDPFDGETCQMATTVTAISDNMDSIWAVGEPGATVTLDPTVPAEQGPTYFNTQVIPEPGLVETTTDGGVVVAGALPGSYVWTGVKAGFTFAPITMRCEPGWLTNAAPPYGLVVATQP